jgi:hypothetical protein
MGDLGIKFKFQAFQDGFMKSEARFPAFVASWGTGKTLCLIARALKESIEHPHNLGVIFRKDFTDLRDSTIKDFELYTKLTVPLSTKEITVPETDSVIMFRHGDELSALQNINLGWFGIEQAEEFETADTFEMLRGRLRRKSTGRRGFIIANTKGHNWIWRLWKSPDPERDPDFQLFEAISFDNDANLPADTLADWRKMEKASPHIFNRFVMNSWEDVDTAEKVIPYSWIKRAIGCHRMCLRNKTIVACDPCGVAEAGGGDEGVIYGLRNGQIIDHDFFRNKQGDQIAARCQTMRRDINAGGIVLDVIGPGAGVINWLSKMGEKNIIAANSAERSECSEPLCYNKRAEFWWTARKAFRESEASIPDDPILIEELSQVGYELTPRGYKIESKEDLKKADRLGRSPNRADCLIYGLWGQTQIDYDSEAVYQDESQGDTTDLGESYAHRSSAFD